MVSFRNQIATFSKKDPAKSNKYQTNIPCESTGVLRTYTLLKVTTGTSIPTRARLVRTLAALAVTCALASASKGRPGGVDIGKINSFGDEIELAPLGRQVNTTICPKCGTTIDQANLNREPKLEGSGRNLTDEAVRDNIWKQLNMGELSQYKQTQCNQCGVILTVEGDGELKLSKFDKPIIRNCAFGLGAMCLGVGLGLYIDTLRNADQKIFSSWGGHVFITLGVVILAFMLFRGKSWRNEPGMPLLYKIGGLTLWSAGSLSCVIALSFVHGAGDVVVVNGHSFIPNIEWTSLLQQPGAVAAFSIGLTCIVCSLLLALYINTKGNWCKRAGNQWWMTLSSSVANIGGGAATIASGAVSLDIFCRLGQTVQVMTPDNYQQTMITDAFAGLSAALFFGLMWVTWLILSPAVFKKNGMKAYSAITGILCAGVAGILIGQGTQFYHHFQINEIFQDAGQSNAQPFAGNEPYVITYLFALLFLFAAVLFILNAKGFLTCNREKFNNI